MVAVEVGLLAVEVPGNRQTRDKALKFALGDDWIEGVVGRGSKGQRSGVRRERNSWFSIQKTGCHI